MGYEFNQENQVWVGTPDEDGEQATVTDDEGNQITDPTAQSGTLDTTDTGETQTAADVSPVFDAADAASDANEVPEGSLAAPGDDAEDDPANDPRYGGQTTDTTGESIAPVASEADAVQATEADADGGTEEADRYDARKDPGNFTVAEVKAYLADATDKQKASVQAKEAKGQNRAGIMNA